ncbi:hypothetical protein [Streptomyces sp. NPDC008001]|uniref:hypothetical protein n=1 Tax=Streptomyces sp. NPDC008001 TaxID=3364804 RepID=UPI0036EBAA13
MELRHDTTTPTTDESAPPRRPHTAKRPYVEPQIDELGTVEHLTVRDGGPLPGSPDARAIL